MATGVTRAQVAVQKCEKCRNRSTVLWNCEKCRELLCGDCKEDHEKTRHSMVVQRKCKKHTQMNISHFCQICDMPCCTQCTNEFHRGHTCLSLDDKIKEVKRELIKYKDNLEKAIVEKIRKKREECTAERNLLKSGSTMTTAEVNQRREYLKQTLCASVDSICDEIIEKMEKKVYEYDYGIDDKMEKVDMQEARVRSLIDECSLMERLDSLDLVDFFARKCPEPESLLPFQTRGMKIPYFEPANAKLTKHDVGRVHFSRSQKDRTQSLTSKMKTIRIKVKEKKEVATPFPPISIAAAENFIWICNQGERDIICIDMSQDGETTACAFKEKVTAIAMKSTTEIIFADTKHDVSLLSTEFSTTRLLFNTGDYMYTPSGLCITSSKKIVVSMNGGRRTSQLRMFDFDGRQEQTILYDNERKVLFQSPGQLVQNGRDGFLAVVDTSCDVVAVTTAGKLLWRYNGEVANTDEDFDPCDVAADHLLNIIVSDNRNHCIHYIDQNGQFIRLIIQEGHGVDFPLGVGVYQQKRLVVGSKAKGLTMFTYLK